MYDLPTSITIDGEPHKIRDKGDFRMVLHCFEVLNAEDLSESERILACLMLFYEGVDTIEDALALKPYEEFVKQMFAFIQAGQKEQKKTSSMKLIDWENDEMLIASAVNNVAGKEIRSEKYLHYWTFIGYYMAIGDCPLSQIVAIRYKISRGEKLEKYEKKFKTENPQYFNFDMRSTAQKDAESYIQNLWNGGEN